MNNCQFVGRLTADPELRRTNDGTAVCSYCLAVKRQGIKDTTDFLDFVTWRQGAEFLSQYGHKGDTVAVSGQLQTRRWTDKNGNNRKAVEVVTSSVDLLSSKRNSQDSENTSKSANAYPGSAADAQAAKQSFGLYGSYPELSGDDPKLPF